MSFLLHGPLPRFAENLLETEIGGGGSRAVLGAFLGGRRVSKEGVVGGVQPQ